MTKIFHMQWFITTVGTWALILILDELAYYWWKSYHPDSQFTGVIAKHNPLQNPGLPLSGTQAQGNR